MSTLKVKNFAFFSLFSGGKNANSGVPPPNGWANSIDPTGASDLSFFQAAVKASAQIEFVLAALGTAGGTAWFAFDSTTPCFSLDGGPTVSANGLPAGITLSLGNFQGIVSTIANTGSIELNPYVAQAIVNNISAPYGASDILSGLTINLTQLIGIVLKLHFNGTNPGPSANVFNWIPSFDFTFNAILLQTTYTLTTDTNPATFGSKVTITSTKKDLNQVKTITLTTTDPTTGNPVTVTIPYDSNLVIEYLSGEMIFYIPFFFFPFYVPGTSISVDVSLGFDGTEFSGSVAAGSFTFLFENASGIYRLDTTATHDNLYFREGFTTDDDVIYVDELIDDDILETDDLFSLLAFPPKILAENYLDNDSGDDSNSLIIPVLRPIIVIRPIAFPSPFFRTAFLP